MAAHKSSRECIVVKLTDIMLPFKEKNQFNVILYVKRLHIQYVGRFFEKISFFPDEPSSALPGDAAN
ncbi:hypothetical protein, partial [Klebsiella quasipneumoniae]|uniref:hypothetical protein n=1 Tax=Klebsiella quasipneumoniae TaxID=1463165 RepID=UPI001D12C6D0